MNLQSLLMPTTLAPLACALVALLSASMSTAATPTAAHAAGGDVARDLRMAQDARPMRMLADAFVTRALAGDGQGSMALLSRALVDRTGEDKVRQAFDAQILPFFGQGREIGRSVTVARTTDALGQTGFAFYMWLLPADGSAPRPFSVYVVEERGRAVVANVVPDRLVEGRHR